jgi:hypothetical protein
MAVTRRSYALLLLVCPWRYVDAHAAMVVPGPPRNAADGASAPWRGGVDRHKVPFGGKGPQWCPIAGGAGADEKLSGANGQACCACMWQPHVHRERRPLGVRCDG